MQEIETKFQIKDIQKIGQRLQQLGALLIRPRTYELNIRYDLPDNSLSKSGRVLRLRQDDSTSLTFKGPGSLQERIVSREEIELPVEGFDQARTFLKALGYQETFTYEKFRTLYDLSGTKIMLDVLPYGDFIEIEGHSTMEINEQAGAIGLRMNAAIPFSYHELFRRVCASRGLAIHDLTFENFKTQSVSPADTGAEYGDN